MRNIILITKREYLTQVKKKSFILLTLFTPLLIILFGGIIGFIFKANETFSRIQVLDKSGMIAQHLKSTDRISYEIINEDNTQTIKSNLKKEETIDGILIIPALNEQGLSVLQKEIKLLVNKNIGYDNKDLISKDLNEIIQREKIKSLGLNEGQIKDIEKEISINVENINDKNNTDSDLSFKVKSFIGGVSMYVVFMFIILYGVRVMRSVLEEKNTRVVEVIISSVKPFELMAGKIFGVTLVAFTQFSIWITMVISANFLIGTELSTGTISQIPIMSNSTDKQEVIHNVFSVINEIDFPLLIVVFLLYFILGYIFYSSIYAAIGSAVDNETETQQFTLIGMIPLIISVYGSVSIINNPDGPIAFWLSIIPLTSPITMITRMPFGVPIWQIFLSLMLLVGAVVLMIFLASKIYRIGILTYGNKITWKELWKWIRQ